MRFGSTKNTIRSGSGKQSVTGLDWYGSSRYRYGMEDNRTTNLGTQSETMVSQQFSQSDTPSCRLMEAVNRKSGKLKKKKTLETLIFSSTK